MADERYSPHELAHEIALLELVRVIDKLVAAIERLNDQYHRERPDRPDVEEDYRRNVELIADARRGIRRALEPILREDEYV